MTASIIITSYNYERYLPDAIDSALAQTYPDVEVVVVDDGSTDRSREIIAGYGDRIVTVLKENGGMGSTYNAGLPAARGEIIFFLDADDMLVPEAVSEVMPLFDDAGVAKVHWHLAVIDAGGRRTSALYPSGTLHEGDFRDALVEVGPDAYLSPPTSGNAWRRSFLEQVLPMPEEEFRQHSDIYLCTLAPLFGSVRLAPRPLSLYRVHGANDYACASFAEKLSRNIAIYALRSAHLQRFLEKQATPVDRSKWMAEGTPYDWMRRLHEAIGIIRSIVPEGESWILADNGEWAGEGGAFVPGRPAVPFTSRNGLYWGPPADDAAAIEEIESARAGGCRWMAIGWPAFWLLEYHEEMREHLRMQYTAVHSSDLLVIYRLEPGE